MALLKAKQEAAAETIAAHSLPAGAKWATEARTAAVARLQDMGLPGRRDEYWRNTNPTALISGDLTPAADDQDRTDVFAEIAALRIVFVDGVFSPDLSDDLSADGLDIELLPDVTQHDIHWAKDIYGQIEEAGQTPVDRPLAAFNTAYATTGVVIRATAHVERPVALIYRQNSEAADVILHHVLRVEPGASLTVLEQGIGGARANSLIEADVADDGALHHVAIPGRHQAPAAVSQSFARLGERSVYKTFAMKSQGVLTRNEAYVELNGADAVAHIAGAVLGDGKVHHDDTVFVLHNAPGCESRQVFKKVLRNGAVGVFQGKILVRDHAQKTDGYQISQSLLLDGNSQFLAKPELEIYADDVICSHGSTTGAIDETSLFYLRSRGLPEADAQNLLVLAFLAEAIDEIEDETISDAVTTCLQGWLDTPGQG